MRSWVLFLTIFTVVVLLVGCSPAAEPSSNMAPVLQGNLIDDGGDEAWFPTEEELTDEGYPMAFLIRPRIEEALQHSEVRALFKDLPPEDERQPNMRIVCSDYHELLRVLKNLGYSEELIEEVMREADF